MPIFKNIFKKGPKKKEPEKLKRAELVKKVGQSRPKPKKSEEEKIPRPVKEKKEAGPKPLPRKKIKIAYRVVIRPIITEKATEAQARGVYTFEIAPTANKILVKQAVEELYNVRPIKVNIIRVQGKVTKYGRSVGRTKDWKKALVFLKEGQKIEFAKK